MFIKSIVAFITRLSKRERVIFYATVFVIGVVILDRTLISPILKKIDDLSEAIATQEEVIEQSLLIVTQEKRIEGETSRYATYLSKPQAEKKEITAFLKEVENIAKRSSAYVVDIKPAGKSVEGPATKYFVKLNFEAQMDQVMNFFYNISNLAQLIKIEGYQIRPKTEGSSIITCNISISKTIILE